jgi:hypothetical protein
MTAPAAPFMTTRQVITLVGCILALALGLRGLFRLGDGRTGHRRVVREEREREADLKNRDGPPRFNG